MQEKQKKQPFKMPKYYDSWIHGSVILLSILGLIMVTSASMGLAVQKTGYLQFQMFSLAKQLVFTVVGYIAMLACAKLFTFEKIQENIYSIIILTFFSLILALFFPETSGARAWIRLPNNLGTIQPSEFSKIVIILIIALYLCDLKKLQKDPFQLIKPPLIIILTYVFIVLVLQKDLGTAVIMLGIGCILFLIPQHPQLLKYQKIITVLFVLGMIAAVFVLSPLGVDFINHLPLKEYQKNRFLSAINPFIDQHGTGYQLILGLVACVTGGFAGTGLGNSIRKYSRFPASDSDFILTILIEELGFVGFLVVLVLYTIIIVRLFRYAFLIKSEKAKVVLIGTAMYLLIHYILNVGGVTGLIPLTGVPLLLISSGGSSSVSILMAIGFSQAIISQYKQGIIV